MTDILFLINSLYLVGGTEKVTVAVANSLVSRGYSVNFAVLGSDTASYFPLHPDIRVYPLEYTLFDRVKVAKNLNKLVKRIRPRYLVNVAVAMAQVSLIARAITTNFPKLYSWEHFNLHAGSRFGYYFRLLSSFLSDRTIVLTDDDRSSYPRFLRKKITTVQNFYIGDENVPLSTTEKKVALAVGRLTSQKRFDHLIKAWAVVAEKFPDWRLQIVGEGPDEKKLRVLIAELGLEPVIEIAPFTLEIQKFYSNASLFVMSSLYEGFPLVLIEAKMHGLPSICYNFKQGPSFVVRDGQDGIIVESGDIAGLSEAISGLIASDHLRKEYGIRGREDAVRRFTLPKVIEKWEEIFQTGRTN